MEVMCDEEKSFDWKGSNISFGKEYEELAQAMNLAASTILMLFVSALFLQIAGLELEYTEILTYNVGFLIGTGFGLWFP